MTQFLKLCGVITAIYVSTPIGNAASCDFQGEPLEASNIKLEKIATGFKRPVAIQFIPGFNDRYYIVEQGGLLKLVIGNTVQPTPALDISRIIDGGNSETGFLGFAFHPQFATNRRIFVNYTTNGALTTHVSEFRVDANLKVDAASEKVLLSVPQPFSNHNGGDIHFGPDGYLYISLGDGGSGGDPNGNGQNLKTLLAKMLRIDIDHGSPYSIPASNPTWSEPGARREIFAYGLRNAWRFSFDRVTGELWAGDVGQNKFEEIDLIVKGGNYGWRLREGKHCFNPQSNCPTANLIEPIFEYPRSEGASITGGYVYRGRNIPELIGAYLYADYVSLNLWSLRYDGTRVTNQRLLMNAGIAISSFGEDHEGELYALDHGKGTVFKIVRASAAVDANIFPRKLSETGCFAKLNPPTPIAGITSYGVSSPLWSDGADKDRFLFLPPQTSVEFKANAPWNFPNRAVLIKTFSLPQANGDKKRMETRFLVKKPEGFKGYTYRWNEAGTDGDLLSGALAVPATIADGNINAAFDYYFPSSGDCERCHNKSTAGALGFDLLHLNHQTNVEGAPQNQILALASHGVFAGSESAIGNASDLAKLPSLPDPFDNTQPLDARAKSYLETQCANCHNPANPARQGDLDLRYTTAFKNMRICNTAPTQGDLGISGAKLVKPGDPAHSLLWVRFSPQDKEKRMPPLATNRVDQRGSELIRSWIASKKDCQN